MSLIKTVINSRNGFLIYVIKNLLVLSFALLSRIENISVISKDAKRQQFVKEAINHYRVY